MKMALIITAVMEVSVIIISCILYHCIWICTKEEKGKNDFYFIFLDKNGRMKKMVETNLFWNMQMPICILFKKCHITYLLIDKVGYEVGNRA